MLRLILYPIIGLLVGFIVGVVAFGAMGLILTTLVCAAIGIGVAAWMNKKDGGVVISDPPLIPDGPTIDFHYLWEYLSPRFPITIGFTLLIVCGALLLKWSGIQANYTSFIGFWIIFGIIISFMPYSRYSSGPDARRLFPSSNSVYANLLNFGGLIVSFAIVALIILWAIETFNV